MGWDLIVFSAPAGVRSVDGLAKDFAAAPLGSASHIRDRLGDALPQLDLSDPTWGIVDGPSWSIELNLGSTDPTDSIMLHVHGMGDDVLPVITEIATATGGRVLDIATGEFLTGDRADTSGWHAFQKFRNRAIDRSRTDQSELGEAVTP